MTAMPRLPATAPFSPGEIEALNGIISATNPAQRHWLAGFLAGYEAALSPGAASAQAPAAAWPVTAPASAPAKAAPLLILYATESGNAEGLAYDAGKRAGRLGFQVKIKDVAEVTPAEAAKASNLLVVASTWGEGDPPERASDFYAALMADAAPRFEGVRYAVLALGDSAYSGFCAVGRRIDERLAELGGERVAERVDCDLDYEAPASSWIDGALATVKALGAGPDGAAAGEGTVVHLRFAPPAEAATETWSKAMPFEAEIAELVNLNGSRSDKSTFHLELALAGSGIAYEPGDSLGIVPENDPALVEAVLEAAGIAPDEAIRADLAHRLEITTLTAPVVERYARLTGAAALQEIVAAGRQHDYAAERHLIDLLAEHPRRLSAEELRGLLRPLPPRLYSIASSRKPVPDAAHLLVGLVSYEAFGRPRTGVASGLVANRRKAGDWLKVYLKPNRHFRLPADPDAPVIMIGPGTGVAPFRAFVQEREAIGAKGRNWLFFGDRHFTHDFLYQLEWQEALKSGALTRLDVAFSRDQPEKVYVQHRMWERRAELHAWLEEGAHLYVCGDEKHMAKDVHAMLARILADRAGLDLEAAEARLAGLRREGRYLRDVY